MPYRDTAAALEAKLRVMLDRRRDLDRSVRELRRDLAIHRARERGARAARLALPACVALGVLLAACAVLGMAAAVMLPCYERANDRASLEAIEVAAELYLAIKPHGVGCPRVYALVEGRFLNAGARTLDEWGQPFVIECDGMEVTVRSAGRDGRHGTEDDLESR